MIDDIFAVLKHYCKRKEHKTKIKNLSTKEIVSNSRYDGIIIKKYGK